MSVFGSVKNFFKHILQSLGLMNKEADIIFLGLDNAGKSTLLHKLRTGAFTTVVPTQHSHYERIVVGKVTFGTYDVGGHDRARSAWKEYYTTISGVVFIVDAADRERIEEAAMELREVLNGLPKTVPVLILGNKIDLPTAMDEVTLAGHLNVSDLLVDKSWKPEDVARSGRQPIALFMSSIRLAQGYGAGFNWLSKFID